MQIKPKKSLGQNFLIDKNIQRKIISACNFKPGDTVLEIGAGRGEFSRLIAGKVKKVYALEIDKRLEKTLKDNLKEFPNIEIIHQDILKFNFLKYFSVKGVKVFGNIPYYITTPIIERLFKYRNIIDTAYLTVQKEFGRRMAALPGSKDYGSFTCFLQYYAQASIIFNIKKNSFFPPPKVDSCFLKLALRREPLVNPKDEDLFFKIIRGSFGKRRKTLRNSLKNIVSPEKLNRFFAQFKINPNIRPEDLSLVDFENLSECAIYGIK